MPLHRTTLLRSALLTACFLPLTAHAQTKPETPKQQSTNAPPTDTQTSFKFNFSSAKAPGYTNVSPADKYSPATGYGFDENGGTYPTAVDHPAKDADPTHAGSVTAEKPFYFSVKVPEGNYKVTVTLGDATAETTTTMKAELRRLLLENITTTAGQFLTRTVAVNVRRSEISTGGAVKMNAREQGPEHWNWDDKLTLEFSGAHPALCSLQIEKADDLTTVYLAGDSTVCDQPTEPFNSWGQMLPRFFKPDVAVQNEAISGETTAGFYAQRRMDKIMSTLKKGDYLFVQFGHNDMKARAVPLAKYKELYTKFVTDARSKGATPIIMTPVSRETFDSAGKITNSFNDFPDAVRQVAKEQNVPLIDLQNISAALYEAIGKDHSQPLFANTKEHTHHSDYGSYEIAQCVAQAIADLKLPLAATLTDDRKPFDPAHPDPLATFTIPPDPLPARTETPAGN